MVRRVVKWLCVLYMAGVVIDGVCQGVALGGSPYLVGDLVVLGYLLKSKA